MGHFVPSEETWALRRTCRATLEPDLAELAQGCDHLHICFRRRANGKEHEGDHKCRKCQVTWGLNTPADKGMVESKNGARETRRDS